MPPCRWGKQDDLNAEWPGQGEELQLSAELFWLLPGEMSEACQAGEGVQGTQAGVVRAGAGEVQTVHVSVLSLFRK